MSATQPQRLQAIPVVVPDDAFALGERFTIEGVRIVGPGRFITNCKPGEETMLVAAKRSVFRLSPPRA